MKKESAELNKILDFLIANRDVIGLSDDAVGRYPYYTNQLKMSPDAPTYIFTIQYRQPKVYLAEIERYIKEQRDKGLIEPF